MGWLRESLRTLIGLDDKTLPAQEGPRLNVDVAPAGVEIDDGREAERLCELAYALAYLEARGWRINVRGETLEVERITAASDALILPGVAEEALHGEATWEYFEHDDQPTKKIDLRGAPRLRREESRH